MDYTTIAELIMVIIGVAATIATLTTNKSDDIFIQFILDVINKLGMNMGKAKNK